MHMSITPLAVTTYHCLEISNIGDMVFMADRHSLVQPFFITMDMDDELDLVMVSPFPGKAITVNSVQSLHTRFS
jgi:hypothetical protein